MTATTKTPLYLLIAVYAVMLTGCTGGPYGRDKAQAYRQAEAPAPLRLPKGMPTRPLEDALAIPAITQPSAPLPADYAVPRPEQHLERLSMEASSAPQATATHQDNPDIRTITVLREDGNGNPLLNIKGVSYARGWAAVGEALQRARIKVVDKNRSAGIYYLLATRSTGNKQANLHSDRETVQLRVSALPGVIQVAVEKDADTSVSKATSQAFLALIKQHLQ